MFRCLSMGAPESNGRRLQFNLNRTVTVMMTGTGWPFRSVGEYSQARTASSAASSSSEIDRRMRASRT